MYSDLLPQEMQEELIQIGDEQTRAEFRIGDIVAGAIAFCRQNQRIASIMEVYSAVGAFCGKSSRTVRDYHAVAAFYTPAIRIEYDVLRFDHFRQATTLGGNWQKALDWAVEQVDTLGRPASVDAMVAQFSPFQQDVDEGLDDTDPGEPAELPEGFGSATKLRMALQAVGEYLEEITLDASTREQAEEALSVLKEISERVTA